MKEQTKVKGVGLYGQAWPSYLDFLSHAHNWYCQVTFFLCPYLQVKYAMCLTVLEG